MKTPKFYRNWSLRARLVICTVLASIVYSLVMYEGIHSTLHTSLSRQQQDVVFDRLHMLRAIVKERSNYLEIIGKDIQWEGEYISRPAYYLRLLDQDGRVLIETPGMQKLIPASWVPCCGPKCQHQHEDVVRRSSNGRFFFLESDCITLQRGSTKLVRMQIALDITSAVTTDRQNHRKLFGFLAFISLVYVAVITVLIRAGLQPLQQLAVFSGGITANRLSDRIEPEQWPLELREIGRSLNGMLDRLEDALTRLSHCASNIAHEIRTPINNLMGETEIALIRDRTPEEYKTVLESTMEECTRLSRLVDNLLFLAHAQNLETGCSCTLFDPIPEIDGVRALYGALADQKGAEVTRSGDVFLYGDPALFRRVIGNLVANAISYSPPGVRVDITVSESEAGWSEVVVKDTGAGIAEKDLPKIFDRFYRADSSRSNYAEGSGLGLSIVKAIMDLHRGTIEVQSKLAVGTTFTLRFPKRGDELP